jgi:hypothetical protein
MRGLLLQVELLLGVAFGVFFLLFVDDAGDGDQFVAFVQC